MVQNEMHDLLPSLVKFVDEEKLKRYTICIIVLSINENTKRSQT